LVWVKRGAWLVLALAVVFGIYKGRALLAAGASKSAGPTYATIKVGTGPVTSTVSDPGTIESATVLGLGSLPRLIDIELPIALPTILAGIRTSAVQNVGFATLGAIIGAGGLGQPILRGIRLNDVSLIVAGAIPAALLALLLQFAVDAIEWVFTPRGLKRSVVPPE